MKRLVKVVIMTVIFAVMGTVGVYAAKVNSEDLYNKATALAQKSSYKAALVELDKAIVANPKVAKYHNLRGMICERTNDYDGALKSYTTAIKLNPNEANYYYNRGVIYNLKYDFYNSFKDYQTTVVLEPGWYNDIFGSYIKDDNVTCVNNYLGFEVTINDQYIMKLFAGEDSLKNKAAAYKDKVSNASKILDGYFGSCYTVADFITTDETKEMKIFIDVFDKKETYGSAMEAAEMYRGKILAESEGTTVGPLVGSTVGALKSAYFDTTYKSDGRVRRLYIMERGSCAEIIALFAADEKGIGEIETELLSTYLE